MVMHKKYYYKYYILKQKFRKPKKLLAASLKVQQMHLTIIGKRVPLFKTAAKTQVQKHWKQK